ncbi:MAG: hypothetical protein BWY31_02543 [Lentisphaerae bacterium ADurb.Bin242]|nr:MAG: hypothetical protein BWY31_02543 [Lentisphaerae bacterium ADurb.Bin242]
MKYYVNKESDKRGDHEVHKEICFWLPDPNNRIALGECANAHEAVRKAKEYYSTADGCYHCCPEAHTH